MRVAIPHRLGKAEARHRLASRVHELANFIPGGVAEVTSDWPSEDRMMLGVAAMGQTVAARIDVGESEVVLDVTLPPGLAFVEPMIRGAIESKGRKLLGSS